jgi:hypothetical protein
MKDTDWSLLAQRAWGRALVKTGIEHLDLGMLRQGKRTLREAETRAKASALAYDTPERAALAAAIAAYVEAEAQTQNAARRVRGALAAVARAEGGETDA